MRLKYAEERFTCRLITIREIYIQWGEDVQLSTICRLGCLLLAKNGTRSLSRIHQSRATCFPISINPEFTLIRNWDKFFYPQSGARDTPFVIGIEVVDSGLMHSGNQHGQETDDWD